MYYPLIAIVLLSIVGGCNSGSPEGLEAPRTVGEVLGYGAITATCDLETHNLVYAFSRGLAVVHKGC